MNFCDFSRFAPRQGHRGPRQLLGPAGQLPAFAVVTVAVTAGSIAVFGETITDPVEIVARIDNVWVTAIGAVTFVIATIGINVVANFVSASYDLANVAPEHIDFRRGGLISAVVAVLITPWHLYSSPAAINYFLGGPGALLGPLFGIIFIDYFRSDARTSPSTSCTSMTRAAATTTPRAGTPRLCWPSGWRLR
nr:cytosine permease [Nocardioides sp. B-3]